MADGGPGTHNEKFADAEARSEKRTEGGSDSWTPLGGLPDVYIAMGQTAENVRRVRQGHARGDGRVRRAVAAARGRVAGERVLRAGDHAGHHARRHRGLEGRRPPSGHDGREARDAEAGVPPRRQGDRRQRVPAQRRRGRGDRDERHEGRGARHHAARPDRRQRRVGARPRDHGPRPDRGVPPGAGARRADDRRHRPRRDQRGVRGAGDPVGPSTSASRGRSSTCTAARSRSATRSA